MLRFNHLYYVSTCHKVRREATLRNHTKTAMLSEKSLLTCLTQKTAETVRYLQRGSDSPVCSCFSLLIIWPWSISEPYLDVCPEPAAHAVFNYPGVIPLKSSCLLWPRRGNSFQHLKLKTFDRWVAGFPPFTHRWTPSWCNSVQLAKDGRNTKDIKTHNLLRNLITSIIAQNRDLLEAILRKRLTSRSFIFLLCGLGHHDVHAEILLF